MLSLNFAGWFQCRMATDPDYYRDPRGHDGVHIALPGEPDLDRVIRFQAKGAYRRSHCPEIGVRLVDPPPEWKNAELDLLNAPVFEGRNGIVATSSNEPIYPFYMIIRSAKQCLHLTDTFDLHDPQAVAQRLPKRPPARPLNDEVYKVLRTAYSDRIDQINGDRKSMSDDELKSCDTRLERLGFYASLIGSNNDPSSIRCEYSLRPLLQVTPSRDNAAVCEHVAVTLRMGRWDADAMCGYVEGDIRPVWI